MVCRIRPIVGGCTEKERSTLMFAAFELQKYLSGVVSGDFAVISTESYTANEENALFVGIKLSLSLAEVENCQLDDAICINAKKLSGIITGTNARATLIAVYRYLKELGFSFVHPGSDGEFFPDVLSFEKINICEKASYRHRGICIEGSVFQKNLTDIIDWLPKVAMNGYFIQFSMPVAFLKRWYGEETPFRKGMNLSEDDIKFITKTAEQEMEKRSLMYHAVGHGWTSRTFDINAYSWETHEEPSDEFRNMLAEIDGERKLFKGIPLNTNLCYSNKAVRQKMIAGILEYRL